jgi:hypothetical protein
MRYQDTDGCIIQLEFTNRMFIYKTLENTFHICLLFYGALFQNRAYGYSIVLGYRAN